MGMVSEFMFSLGNKNDLGIMKVSPMASMQKVQISLFEIADSASFHICEMKNSMSAKLFQGHYRE